MSWRPRLSLSGSIVLFALLAAAPALPARAQEQSTQERLDRLERDLSMLQRQVYSRAGAIPHAGADSGTAVDIEIRMERLEQQMRDLTGRVESAVNQVQQLRQRIEQINSDIAVRLGESGQEHGQGHGQGHQARAGRAASPGGPGSAASGEAASSEATAGAAEPDSPTPPASIAGGGPPSPPTAPAPPAASSASAEPPAHERLPTGSASAQYNFAFGLLKEANYPAAERALRAFIRQHPGEPLAGNAHYWLGETYYVRGRFADAAAAFAEGYRRFPKGTKAPDELLKLGMSLSRAGERQNACVAFAQLDRAFPHARLAIKERAKSEKERAGC